MSCDEGETVEGLENELWRRWSDEELDNEAEPTSQLILQPFRSFTYVTVTSPTHKHFTYITWRAAHEGSRASFSMKVGELYSPWRLESLILEPLHRFTYVTAILQHFRRFTYVTVHSTTLPLFYICHRHFTYVTWRATLAVLSIPCNICVESFFFL